MNFKKLVQDFYRILKTLPNYGKVLAVASVATLYVAINPSVKWPTVMGYEYNWVRERDGKMVYALRTKLAANQKPTTYVNTGTKPHPGDEIVIIKVHDRKKPYFFRHEFGKGYRRWEEAIYDYRKSQKRKRMIVSFLFSTGLCLASYPGLVRRMLALIPKGK